ncbi:MAG: DUF4271 domain-containing protein [Muribaculaceae bacterium]|nr:DUF4271 domain-containing protein [Muribaculaceae bacterium]
MPTENVQNITDTTLTTTPDSVAAPVKHKAQYLNGFPVSQGNDTTIAHIDRMSVIEVPKGSNARTHNTSPLHDTGSMIMLLISCIFLMTSYRLGRSYISNLGHYLFSPKGKDDLFAEHTSSDAHIIIAMIANTCLMGGIMMYYGLLWYNPSLTVALQNSVFLHVLVLTLAMAIFVSLQLLLYRLLGYTFATDSLTDMWVQGFLASQAVLGLLLFPVAVITLVFPSFIKQMVTMAIILYILGRIVFICKGFRIFFNNLSSSIYFILYLCAVEIVPPLLALAGTVYVCSIL